MKTGKAAGPDKVAPEHLQVYLRDSQALREGLLPVVNMALRGQLPEGVASLARAGCVTPLYKDSMRSKIRPIVPLNSLRKLVALILLQRQGSALRKELRPFQWGVGERAGVESDLILKMPMAM